MRNHWFSHIEKFSMVMKFNLAQVYGLLFNQQKKKKERKNRLITFK